MSEADKKKHAERISQKETKLAKKVKLAKTYNHEDALKDRKSTRLNSSH